jgi:signal transduction histidine kinase
MTPEIRRKSLWLTLIIVTIILISVFHYSTPTMQWQYHLVLMQSYFLPILVAAFQFGFRGGVGAALLVSAMYLPHVMLHWGGLVEGNLMRFLQIGLYNIIGLVTGIIAEREYREKAKLRELTNELSTHIRQIEEQQIKLAEMEEQLRVSDRMAIVGELTASLAHEVRNPLASILGAVEILRGETENRNDREEFFRILVAETERLNRVVETYLSFSRSKETEIGQFEVGEVLTNIVMMLESQAKKHSIRMKLELPDGPLELVGDSGKLWEVLINLVLNSMQAMEERGEIQIAAQQAGSGECQIIIRDQGPGIPADLQEKIFTPFFTTKERGTGLGLAIVRRIVDENRWNLALESTVGEGTAFILDIRSKK